VLQWVAVGCNALLQCVAMFYRNRLSRRLSAAPMYAAQFRMMFTFLCSVLLQCVAAFCCNVSVAQFRMMLTFLCSVLLQSEAMCCSLLLQCVYSTL